MKRKIVCLCGSTRFRDEYFAANWEETMRGNIVLSVGFYRPPEGPERRAWDSEKVALDALHLDKIKLADEVLVIDVGGYVGESTRNEIAYAHAVRIPVRYWSVEKECEQA